MRNAKRLYITFEHFLDLILFVLFSTILYLGSLLPLYTDEILWRMINSRMIYDEGKLQTLLPLCGTMFSALAPVSLWPARYIESLLYLGELNPWRIRTVGLLVAALICLSLTVLIVRLDRGRKVFTAGLAPALLGFGLLPLFLLMNRPDSLIVLAVVVSLIIFIYNPHSSSNYWELAALAFLLFLGYLTLTQHPSGLFFLLLFLYGFYRWRGTYFLKYGVGSLLIATGVGVYSEGVRRVSCDLLTFSQAELSGGRLLPQTLFSEPARFLTELFNNAMRYPEFLQGALLQSSAGNQWILLSNPTSIQKVLFYGSNFFQIFLLLSVLLLGFLSFYYRERVASCAEDTTMKVDMFLALACIYGCILLAGGGGGFYESIFHVILPSIVALGLISQYSPERFLISIRVLMCLTKLGSTLSMSLIAVNFWKPLHSNWTAGVLRPEAPYLVKIDGFENERKKVQQISTECGFDFAHHGYRIATDEMTYLSLHHKSIAPLNVFFIKSKFRLKGESITDALKRVSSSGLIAKLTSLEAADRKSCRILDEYCCIGPLA